MADLEILDDVKKSFSGKGIKKYTPFIIGGVALGLIVLLTKKNTSSTDENINEDNIATSPKTFTYPSGSDELYFPELGYNEGVGGASGVSYITTDVPIVPQSFVPVVVQNVTKVIEPVNTAIVESKPTITTPEVLKTDSPVIATVTPISHIVADSYDTGLTNNLISYGNNAVAQIVPINNQVDTANTGHVEGVVLRNSMGVLNDATKPLPVETRNETASPIITNNGEYTRSGHQDIGELNLPPLSHEVMDTQPSTTQTEIASPPVYTGKAHQSED